MSGDICRKMQFFSKSLVVSALMRELPSQCCNAVCAEKLTWCAYCHVTSPRDVWLCGSVSADQRAVSRLMHSKLSRQASSRYDVVKPVNPWSCKFSHKAVITLAFMLSCCISSCRY